KVSETAPSDTSTEAITSEKLKNYISQLENSCNDFDGDETVRLAKEASAYAYNGKPLRTWLGRIAEYAADFEYDSAFAELETMRAEIFAEKEQG
ncbi:MAG: hypothetical protein IJ385_02455, partial [Ruminiclostridium sp.]|nr:hypothetical protein [Ruminiclostridium sp.]